MIGRNDQCPLCERIRSEMLVSWRLARKSHSSATNHCWRPWYMMYGSADTTAMPNTHAGHC